MGLLVDDLLLLARLDQQRPLERVPVDLVAVVAESVAEARVLAPARSIELTVREGVAPQVLGDEARLRQVVTNLMSNALTHTPEGTPVKVAVGALDEESTAILSVADSGPGLSPEEAKRVFERFYRVDPSRTRAAGGSGLGLSIVARWSLHTVGR
jgi:two-component system OmpR family sensor kinase